MLRLIKKLSFIFLENCFVWLRGLANTTRRGGRSVQHAKLLSLEHLALDER
jgi:hypothetical protein